MNTLAPSFLNQSSSFLQVTRTSIKAWIKFKFRPDTASNSRVICPCASEKLMYNVVNTLAPSFLYRIFFIFTGKEDNHYISDEFEFQPDLTKDCGVSCP